MSLPILNVLENLGVPSVASEVLILNEPFDWSNTNSVISQIEDRMTARSIELVAKKKILKIVLLHDILLFEGIHRVGYLES